MANKQNKNKINDDKLKPLMPSLRQKKRFIKIKINSNKKFDFKTLSENLIEQFILFLGSLEVSNSGIWILRDKFNEKNQTLIIKVSTKTKNKLCGILSLIQKIENEKVSIQIINVSGTLKGVEKISTN